MSIGALSISFGAGFKYYGQYVDKRPCVYNLSKKAFENIHQEILEDNTAYDETSELGQKVLKGGFISMKSLEKNM